MTLKTYSQQADPLWTAEEIARAIGVIRPTEINPNMPITGISIDSRTLCRGDLFIPLIDQRDGHQFIDNAIKAGAALIIAHHTYEKNAPYILKTHDNTLRALEKLALAARKRTQAKIIAVTGSVGKTTFKKSLQIVLNAYLKKTEPNYSQTDIHASEKSFNNHIGVPLSVARMHKKAKYAVFELGMNAEGEINENVQFVKPDVAVITNVGPVHLQYFKSENEIAYAKAEIFNVVKQNATAILNADNTHFKTLKHYAQNAGIKKIISFGCNQNADFKLCSFNQNPKLNGGTLKAVHKNIPIQCAFGMNGKHGAINILALCATLYALNIKIKEIIPSLVHAKPEKGRGNIRKITYQNKIITLIDESYNANPISMRAALENLKAYQHQNTKKHKIRRIAILGDMLELGQDAKQIHQKLAQYVVDAADEIYLCGEYMKSLWEKIPQKQKAIYKQKPQDIYHHLRKNIKHGDVIMVKASRALKLENIIQKIKQDAEKYT